MKKNYIFSAIFFLLLLNRFAGPGEIPSLKYLANKVVCETTNWSSKSIKNLKEMIVAGLVDPSVLIFTDCEFRDDDWSEICLQGATFNSCKFNNIQLNKANLNNTIFNDTSFYNVDLRDASIQKATFNSCDLRRINLSLCHKKWPDICLEMNILDHSNVIKLFLQGTKFKECNFYLVNFKDKDINRENIYFQGVIFDGCEFSRVDLRNTDLTYVVLNNSSFEKVELGGILLGEGIGIPPKFEPKNLVKLYSYFIKSAKVKKSLGIEKESQIFYEKAKALNKIMRCLKITLYKEDREGLDLEGIDLKNAQILSISLEEEMNKIIQEQIRMNQLSKQLSSYRDLEEEYISIIKR